jgi:hypothetical protein
MLQAHYERVKKMIVKKRKSEEMDSLHNPKLMRSIVMVDHIV